MVWGRMNDKFHRSRKVRELRKTRAGREALGTWVFWWSWCLDGEDLTGVVPADELSRDDDRCAPLLVSVGLWEPIPGGYRFHNFNRYNPTREQVDARRERDRSRRASERAVQRGVEDDSTPESPSDTGAGSAADSTPKSKVESHPRASQPIPSQPNPTQPREDARSALAAQAAARADGTFPTLAECCAGQSGAMVEVVAERLSALGLRRVESLGHTQALAWIAERPAVEVLTVVANMLADPWVRSHLGRASTPAHLRRHWHRYLDGPAPERGPSAVAPADRHIETEPEWGAE